MHFQVTHRLVISIVGGAILLGGLSGCQVTKTSLQMDSDNRTPFFGLQLGTKKKKSEPDAVPLGQSEMPANKVVTTGFDDEGEKPRSGWSKLFGRFGRPKRIPLPLTDSTSDVDSPETIAADLDGLAGF